MPLARAVCFSLHFSRRYVTLEPMTRLRLKNDIVPPALAAWVLTDDRSRPRFWATFWEGVLSRGRSGTTSRHLANIERFYHSAARTLGGDHLDAVISARDFDRLEACLTAYLATLRNDAARRNVDLSDPWKSALFFVRDVMGLLGVAEERLIAQTEARLIRLDALYSQIAPRRKRQSQPIRSLPGNVVEDLDEIFHPHSSRNPFKTDAIKVRNYLIYLFYSRIGLRRGEGLILAADAVKSDWDLRTGREYHWINVVDLEQEDPRYLRPSLKTTQSQRQITIDPEIVELYDVYVANYRLPSKYSALFISQKRRPLSVQAIADIFKEASQALSDQSWSELEARRWPKRNGGGKAVRQRRRWVSPHDLRHTAVVALLKGWLDQGIPLDEALAKLRVYFGWSPRSQMPFLYARGYWQSAQSEMSSGRFDEFVTILREADQLFSESRLQ